MRAASLDVLVEPQRALQRLAQSDDRGAVGEAPLEKQLAEDAPVVRVVPQHLDRHHALAAEQRVLVLAEGLALSWDERNRPP